MCSRIPLFAAVLGLPFAIADLVLSDIQQTPTQKWIPTRTSTRGGGSISESPIHRYNAYASRITAPPAIHPQQLFARQTVDDRLCAYANGDGASPIYCPRDYTCTLLGPFSTAWGCCNPRGCVNAPRTCFEENDPNNFCIPTGNKPKCATYIVKTNTLDPQDTGGPESWSCAASSTKIFVFVTPIANADARVTYTDIDTDTSASSPTSTNPPNSQNKNNNDKDGNDNRRGLDIGAIIGIIVAVIGVLATVMVGLFPRQMTRCLTCGLRPKKDQTNEEIRKNFWLYISGRGAVSTSQLHIHYHNTPVDQQQLAQAGAPIGLSPITSPGGQHQGYWPQQQQQAQWGHTGYGQHPPPAYQQGYGHGVGGEYISPGQYAAPQRYEAYEQQQPFLEMEDTGKKK
ncbi:hypothetical protein AOL_s00215g408 [Orbilia oligospora ATCC 24927]|uniref:Mid2 domain-containing protein n=1 Tax=Arthrobotrys oligospora (strain ATCC 24927 / CBS 115.81 / DSM 1491) TaxID=756982 RepID=G1XSR0_ARTOA|nr:hypothetical protein AOL_s00215g408 [Orbilia oligospora ATCC 24927]EGX43672.1 hypothetical protein AOL_s00215g408 [Orbilia oligospora ATCC 24927]